MGTSLSVYIGYGIAIRESFTLLLGEEEFSFPEDNEHLCQVLEKNEFFKENFEIDYAGCHHWWDGLDSMIVHKKSKKIQKELYYHVSEIDFHQIGELEDEMKRDFEKLFKELSFKMNEPLNPQWFIYANYG